MNNLKINLNLWRRLLIILILSGILSSSLQGCFGILASSALISSFVAMDRRTLNAQTEDKAIIVKSESSLYGVLPKNAHVNVTSFNRKVLLTGEVPNKVVKEVVGRKIANIPGVQGVFNELKILDSSSFSSRFNDTFITSKVLANLVDAKNLYSNAFKIVTERGVVYIMGRVTRKEGERAAIIASRVSGVREIVTLYEYITDIELDNNIR